MAYYMLSVALVVFIFAVYVVFCTIDVVLMRAVPHHWTTEITGRIRNYSLDAFCIVLVVHILFTLYMSVIWAN